MPALGRRHDHAALVFQAERGQRFGFGLRFRRLLDHAPLAVQPVELGRDARGFGDIAFEQQPHAEIGAPDPTAGVDARPEHEAEMPGFRRSVEPRHIHQRGMADMVAPAHRDQALGDEGAIEADQRRDIGDRAERDVMQHAQKIGLGHLAAPEAARAQLAVHRDQRDQDEPDGGEMTETGEIVRAVRIHQRIDLGQLLAGLVMVDDDDRHAEPLRLRQRFETGGAAIDGNQQRGAFRGQSAHRLGVGAIALEQAVGNMNQRIEPAMPQMPRKQRGRRRAVDIIVTEDRDLFAAHGRIRDALRRDFHVAST